MSLTREEILESKIKELEASTPHRMMESYKGIKDADTGSFMGSGVIISITPVGNHETIDYIMKDTLICDGLSDATIEAIKSDIARSYSRLVEVSDSVFKKV